jgi:RPA family protein
MESFKRTPTVRMLAAEVTDTTVELPGDKDQNKYAPVMHLCPTGAEVNRVLIAGTAVEKEDVGTDNSFWRLRVADPTGAIFVYAGQYQPEAAKVISKLEVPCFVIVSGKLAHYNPGEGGTIVSVRAESIAAVSIELRDLALSDIAHHTVKRFLDAGKNEKVKENYPGYDCNTFIQGISTLLDQILDDRAPAVNGASAVPPAAPTSQPVPPTTPAVQAPSAQNSKPVTETPAEIPVKAAPEKPKRNRKKGGVKTASPGQETEERPEEPKEVPKEAPKVEAKPGGIPDSAHFVLDILKTHRQESGLPKDTIQNVLKALGYAMLDVDSILAKLKTAGEIIELREGVFRAV